MRRETLDWRGIPAVRYSAGGTAVTVVPARGAKIVSLRDGADREWLAQGDGLPPDPGAAFVDAEMCGWDECIPTIVRSRTQHGAVAADHGDAWDRAWGEEADARVSIALPSVDATVERDLSIDAEGVLTLSYRVTAAARGAEVLWAAHPLFRLGLDDRIGIDAAGALWDVSDGSPVRESRPPEASVNAPLAPGTSAKYYTDPDERPRWARIDRAQGGALVLSWAGAAVRTLGVWIDRSRFAVEDVVAFEPSTGWYDSLENAALTGRVLRLGPEESVEWTVSVAFAETEGAT